MKTFKEFLNESSKQVTIDVEYQNSDINTNDYNKKLKKDFNLSVKMKGRTAYITGDKKMLYKFLTHPDGYDMDKEDVRDNYPEVL